MSEPHDRLRIEQLREAIKPVALRFFATLGSTQTMAERLSRDRGLVPPAVVLAARQTAGRGRGEASWWSLAPGCLTMTIVLPHRRPPLPSHELAIRAAVAVADAIESDQVRLKWPNDLVARVGRAPKKLGGILCLRTARADIIGVGLNVNTDRSTAPRALRGRITSLEELEGKSIDLTDLAAAVVKSITARLTDLRLTSFRSERRHYAARDALRRRRIKLDIGKDRCVIGTAAGIDAKGRLILRIGRELRAFGAGHVVRW